jgi:hypothetical protein
VIGLISCWDTRSIIRSDFGPQDFSDRFYGGSVEHLS